MLWIPNTLLLASRGRHISSLGYPVHSTLAQLKLEMHSFTATENYNSNILQIFPGVSVFGVV